MCKVKRFDIKSYASVENAKKCLDNADRLLIDASKTSSPTRVALLELGVEEYSKGLIILLNADEQHENIDIREFLTNMRLQDSLRPQCVEQFKTITSIKTLNPYNHREKLKAIKLLFDFASGCYQILFGAINIEQITQSLNGMNFGTFNIPTSTGLLETIKNIKICEWEEVKERALYVNFEDGEAIAPEKQDLKVYLNEILKVFIIARFILFSYLNLYEGKDFKAMFRDPKTLLGPFYDIIGANAKEGQHKVKV